MQNTLVDNDTINTFRERLAQISPPVLAVILAVMLFFGGELVAPGFANYNQAANIVRLAAFLGIIAAGQTLVIISGGEGIDLSVGAVVTLSAIITFRVTDGQNTMIPIGLLLSLGAGGIIGLINGIGITYLSIPPLVITLGMAGVVQGVVLALTRGELLGSTPPLMSTLISKPLFFDLSGVIVIWIVFGIGMWLLLERTTYGRHLFAIGVNRTAARLSGVRVVRTIILTYLLSGILAAFGGFILLGFTQTVFLNLGAPLLFPSIAAVVVGGTLLSGGKGSYWGTMSGALVLRLIESLLRARQLQEAFQLIILGTVLVLLITVYGRQRKIGQ